MTAVPNATLVAGCYRAGVAACHGHDKVLAWGR
jgi:hypothetical protein